MMMMMIGKVMRWAVCTCVREMMMMMIGKVMRWAVCTCVREMTMLMMIGKVMRWAVCTCVIDDDVDDDREGDEVGCMYMCA